MRRVPVRTIRAVALTTYYTYRAPSPGDNAFQARAIICWVKYNQPSWCKVFDVLHPDHPSGSDVHIAKRPDAIKWVVDVAAYNHLAIQQALNLPAGQVAFVPVPTSSVTEADRQTARWGARDIAMALAARRLGKCVLAVLNKRASPSKAQGAHQSVKELQDNYVAFEQLPDGLPVMYVDDVLTWGRHVVAADRVLGCPPAGLLVVGTADSEPRDALAVRLRKISMGPFDQEPSVADDEE